MGVAALILGILSIIVGFIPFCNLVALVPAIVGLILGIVEIVKKNKAGEPKGLGIAGTVLSALAIVIIPLWTFVFTAGIIEGLNSLSPEELNELVTELNSIEYQLDY